MIQDEREAEAQIVRMLGEKQAALMKQRTPSRICGLLTAAGRSDEWEKAFEHISLHFLKTIPGKPAHSQFHKKYREKEALKQLIKEAASRPSAVRYVMLTIDAEPRGGPGIKIVRAFPQPVGDRPDLNCLLVFADHHGTLKTARPGTTKEMA